MRLLLDTHSLIWFYQTDPRMSAAAVAAIQDPGNVVLVSPASYWEVAIKLSSRKPNLQVPYDVFIQEAIVDNNFTILPIETKHTALIPTLAAHHRDPFDRLLICQAMAENIPLVSRDVNVAAYPVQRLW